jgi:Carboxylesterase family
MHYIMSLVYLMTIAGIALAASPTQISVPNAAAAPTVRVLNGTYAGIYLPSYQQDAFLGMPFAQPPLGDLRFRWPRELNSSWNGFRTAAEFGYSCYQYNSRTDLNEDCLTLNGRCV